MNKIFRMLAWLVATTMLLVGCSKAEQEPVEEPVAPTASATVEDETSPTPSPTPSPSPSPSPSALGPALPSGTLTALVIGTDSRGNDWGGLSDQIMVVQLSADRKDLTIVSIARDTYVEIPGYNRGKINSAFGKGGIPLLRDTVSNLLGGLPIDYVVQTNFQGFIALTRAMDGFTVDNKHANTRTVISTGRVVEFPEGEVLLENTDGLIYVRERKALPLGDLDRAERGRAALEGMMHRLVDITQNEPEMLPELLPMIYRNVKVSGDIQVEHLPVLIDLGRGIIGGGEVHSLMVPIAGFGNAGGQSVNMLDTGRTQELGQALKAGDITPYLEKYGEDYAPTGNR